MSGIKNSEERIKPGDVEKRLRDNGMEARRTLESRVSDHSLYSFGRRGYVEKNRRHVGSYKDSQIFRTQVRTEVASDGARSAGKRSPDESNKGSIQQGRGQTFKEPISRGYNPYR